MKSLREQFEEEYAPVQVPADNKDGFKIEYVYCGPWYIWDLSAEELKKKKIMFLSMCCGSLILYIISGLMDTVVNKTAAPVIAGVLGLCLGILELIAVWQFVKASGKAERMVYNQVNETLKLAPVLQGIVMAAAAVLGVLELVTSSCDLQGILAVAGYAGCSAIAFVIYLEYNRIPWYSEKNTVLNQYQAGQIV